MAHSHLATYLQDHRAGAVAAIGLLEHLEANPEPRLAAFATPLRLEIEGDIDTLERVMQRCDVPSSSVRKAGGWIAEKVSALKTAIDDPSDGSLRTLETIEALALGIDGKRALWLSLAASPDQAVSGADDFDRLIDRADRQRHTVELYRRVDERSSEAVCRPSPSATCSKRRIARIFLIAVLAS